MLLSDAFLICNLGVSLLFDWVIGEIGDSQCCFASLQVPLRNAATDPGQQTRGDSNTCGRVAGWNFLVVEGLVLRLDFLRTVSKESPANHTCTPSLLLGKWRVVANSWFIAYGFIEDWFLVLCNGCQWWMLWKGWNTTPTNTCSNCWYIAWQGFSYRAKTS